MDKERNTNQGEGPRGQEGYRGSQLSRRCLSKPFQVFDPI